MKRLSPRSVQTIIRSLKVPEWPERDRVAWEQATRPGGRLTKGGGASHLKSVTQNDLANRYGLFLNYLQRCVGPLPETCAEAVTPERVAGFIAELKQRVSSVTVQGSIAKLLTAASILSPDTDFSWLREIANVLALDMRPASKFHRTIDTQEIVRAGLAEMARATESHKANPIRQAEIYRNGLMVALLAVCPIRSKNFCSLEIGRQLIEVGDTWHVVLKATETKERRIDERPLPAFLTPCLETYLTRYRPIFGHKGAALWVGRSGQPLSPITIARILTETTRRTLRKAISPHLFRTCAASTAYQYAGHIPNLASALLNHRSSEVTEQHYNRAHSITFSKKFAALVDELK